MGRGKKIIFKQQQQLWGMSRKGVAGTGVSGRGSPPPPPDGGVFKNSPQTRGARPPGGNPRGRRGPGFPTRFSSPTGPLFAGRGGNSAVSRPRPPGPPGFYTAGRAPTSSRELGGIDPHLFCFLLGKIFFSGENFFPKGEFLFREVYICKPPFFFG